LLLYELCTQRRPYPVTWGYREMLTEVARRHYRPTLPGELPEVARIIITDSWAPDRSDRPVMCDVVELLESELSAKWK